MTTADTQQLKPAGDQLASANGDGLIRHNGDALTAEFDVFAEAPAAIGELKTCDSTLKIGKKPMAPWLRTAIAVVAGLVVTSLITAALSKSSRWQPWSPDWFINVLAIGAIPGVLVGWATVFATRFRHTCTFTGTQGVASCTILHARDAEPSWEMFEFKNASTLRTGQTRHYLNGVYTGTSYRFTWNDTNGKKVFVLTGKYNSRKSTPTAASPYWFAVASELAWSRYLLPKLQEDFESNGYVEFAVSSGESVRVLAGALEFVRKGEATRIEAHEIKTLSLSGGSFSIAHKDAKWFSSKGKYHFNYANMANARLFLMSVEMLLGYQFG